MNTYEGYDRYWYIYEADDIDLTTDAWITRSSTGIEWEKVSPNDYIEYQHMIKTGWDGTGDWYRRIQDHGPNRPLYPEVQVVKHRETGKQHLVTLMPLPDRGDPKFLFYLGYMPFFLEPAERDERYHEMEGV